MNISRHTGTVATEAEAERQEERVKQIMAETGCVFGEAVNQYIREEKCKSIPDTRDLQ